MARRPLVAGNWKMHLDHLEAIALVQQLAYHLEVRDFAAVEIAVVPPFTALRSIQTLIEGDRLDIALGAQNCHWEDKGAFTGEISPPMLARLKCTYVLCGHSERRTLFGCVVILTGAVLLFASLLYAAEREVQPDKFGTIPQAMWWAIVTLGTVGYGDVVPVTPLGKFISTFAIIAGFAMIALPVAIISTAFAEELKRRDFVVTWGMLARVPLFSHLSASEIADIMRLLRARTIEQGEVLVRRGDAASSMYFITAGEVEIALPSQQVRLTDGTFFGEIALLHKTKRSGTVTATRKTRLLVLDAQDFHALIARMPTLAEHVHTVAKARLADSGDLAAAELAQAEREVTDR